jgi:Tfp pilus assembly protein PilO
LLVQTQVEVAIAAQRQPQTDESAIQVAEVFQVTKAMPDDDDMPGIILELNSVASAAGIEFLSIAPQAAAVQASYTALAINLSFEGNYYDLTDFLFRLRNLVSVRDGELQADGRLYALETLSMLRAPGASPRSPPR